MRVTSLAIAAVVGMTSAAIARPARAQQPDEEEIPATAKPATAKPAQAPPAPPPPAPPAAVAPPSAPAPNAEIEALRREVLDQRTKLTARIDALETQLAAERSAPPPPAQGPFVGGATPFASVFGKGAWALSAYVQAQYESHQDSDDQIQQGGGYLNQDRFLVRRGRLGIAASWQWADLAVEIDANTIRGPSISPKRLEASLVYRGGRWDGKVTPRGPRATDPPPLMLTVGLTDVPFGYELVDLQRDRVFVERSTASNAFFPGEQDVGIRLSGGIGFFRYALALCNGEPLGDRSTIPVGDPNKAKDVVLRVGADARPNDSLRFSGGVSALYGKGFHAGTDATKDSVAWTDLNQNGIIDGPNELTGVPGTAATPSQNFTRWAVGVDLEARFHTPLGWSTIYGEATIAQNLDRGLFVADPVATSVDVRELGGYAAFVQQITPYGLVGFRYDYYDPNADFFDKRAGKLVPSTQRMHTFSPLVGLELPGRARLVFEYDVVRDFLARDALGVPTDLANNRWTLRLQVEL